MKELQIGSVFFSMPVHPLVELHLKKEEKKNAKKKVIKD